MTTGQTIKILRKKEVLAITGLSKSSLHLRINDETMVPSISLGERAVGFIENEVQAVLASMVAGKSKDELRDLVRDLVTKRQQIPS
jgi:prophage regulatory protein